MLTRVVPILCYYFSILLGLATWMENQNFATAKLNKSLVLLLNNLLRPFVGWLWRDSGFKVDHQPKLRIFICFMLRIRPRMAIFPYFIVLLAGSISYDSQLMNWFMHLMQIVWISVCFPPFVSTDDLDWWWMLIHDWQGFSSFITAYTLY